MKCKTREKYQKINHAIYSSNARWYCAQMNDFFDCPKMRLFFSQTRHKTALTHEKFRSKIVLASEILSKCFFLLKTSYIDYIGRSFKFYRYLLLWSPVINMIQMKSVNDTSDHVEALLLIKVYHISQ